tara:strand:+ start:3882 stop:4769 length:888 start_codon:yes stop_codon:yes gene_type:complete
MKKNYLVITGGAGFVGTNLIKKLIKFKKYTIISIDDYSSGSIKNHIKHKKVKYIKNDTKNIEKVLNNIKNKIHTIFHFGEFSRIYQSFLKYNQCLNSNTIGSNEVFKFCLKNNIKLVYSATSASLGNRGTDKNLSPYAFTKAKNLEMLENLKKWFGFKYEVIYFYNVYGSHQITKGDMATVIGIFQERHSKNLPLTIVKPGTQTRRFTHIDDTIDVCIEAWKKNKCVHYSISNKTVLSIIDVAKLFKSKITFLPKRSGERYASALTTIAYSNKIHRRFGKKKLKDYIERILKKEE